MLPRIVFLFSSKIAILVMESIYYFNNKNLWNLNSLPTHTFLYIPGAFIFLLIAISFPTYFPSFCLSWILFANSSFSHCLKLGSDDTSRENGEKPCHSMPYLELIGFLEKSQQGSVPCSETHEAQLFSTPVPHSRTKFLFTIFKRLPSV